jgi:hypothetical protein
MRVDAHLGLPRTPPPKLGEGSTDVARNEQKGGRGRGLPPERTTDRPHTECPSPHPARRRNPGRGRSGRGSSFRRSAPPRYGVRVKGREAIAIVRPSHASVPTGANDSSFPVTRQVYSAAVSQA